MTPAERAIVIANTLDVFLGSRQKNQQLDAVVNEIKEAEQEAYAKGFADAIEKAAKVATFNEDYGCNCAHKIRALKPEGGK